MVKIKFDVSGSDPEAAIADVAFEQAPAGVYMGRLDECNTGYSKDEEGKPDKTRPRLECIYKLVATADGEELDKNYSRTWDYVALKSEAGEWKLDQFAQAMDLADSKKRKGTIDTKAIAKKADGEETGHEGKLVKLRVIAGKDLDGNYRARVGGVFKHDGDTDDVVADDDDVIVEEEEEGEWTEEDIDNMKAADLKQLVKDYEIEVPKGSKVADVKQLVKDYLFSEDEEEEWGEEEEEDDGAEDDLPF